MEKLNDHQLKLALEWVKDYKEIYLPHEHIEQIAKELINTKWVYRVVKRNDQLSMIKIF